MRDLDGGRWWRAFLVSLAWATAMLVFGAVYKDGSVLPTIASAVPVVLGILFGVQSAADAYTWRQRRLDSSSIADQIRAATIRDGTARAPHLNDVEPQP